MGSDQIHIRRGFLLLNFSILPMNRGVDESDLCIFINFLQTHVLVKVECQLSINSEWQLSIKRVSCQSCATGDRAGGTRPGEEALVWRRGK